MDVLSPEARVRVMQANKGRNTKPELLLRSALHRMGYRFRIHASNLPGNPDLVLPKYTAVIFVHGCFWHGHDCPAFKWPRTRPDFWRSKIERNRERDRQAVATLIRQGWRTATVWECALRKKTKVNGALATLADWLPSKRSRLELP